MLGRLQHVAVVATSEVFLALPGYQPNCQVLRMVLSVPPDLRQAFVLGTAFGKRRTSLREVEPFAVSVWEECADLIPIILLAFAASHDVCNVAGLCHSFVSCA